MQTSSTVTEETVPAEVKRAELSPRSARYERIMHQRSRDIRHHLVNLVSFGVQLGEKGGIGIPGMYVVGSNLFFSIRRAWVPSAAGRKDVVAVILSGYRAGYSSNGKVVLGGEAGNVCTYDMRFVPGEDGKSGKILSWNRPETVEMALQMDLTAERSMKDGSLLRSRLDMPKFWASFPEKQVPLVEETAAATKLALKVLHPDYRGPLLPCLRSPGGIVSEIHHNVEGGTAIGFDSACGADGKNPGPSQVVILPPCAVFHPNLKVGTRFDEGVRLADFAPLRVYQSWGVLAKILGGGVADWLMREAVLSQDLWYGNKVLRPLELCPEGAESSLQIVEDVRHLVSRKGHQITQVVRTEDGSALVGETPSLKYDLRTLNPRWAHQFVE